MNTILKNTTSSAIVAAIEGNFAASLLYFSRYAPTTTVHNDEELLSIHSQGVGPNAVVYTRFAAGDLEARVARALAPFETQNTSMLWWIWPSTRHTDVGPYLEAHGLVYRGEGPGMALDLANLPDTLPVPEDLTIELVQNRRVLREWMHTSTLAASGTETVISEEALAFEERLSFDGVYRRYLGRLNGKPVATSAVFYGAGVAGISCVTTLPAVRRRGIGAALTSAPLHDAHTQGYRIAVLLSSPLGFPVYSRLGFRECCRIRSYIRMPE